MLLGELQDSGNFFFGVLATFQIAGEFEFLVRCFAEDRIAFADDVEVEKITTTATAKTRRKKFFAYSLDFSCRRLIMFFPSVVT